MKQRPRRVENRVAEYLTEWSKSEKVHWVFERRPAMGRSGPDIEFPNPYDLAIDVKSRKSISDMPWKITDLNREVKWAVSDWYICRIDFMSSLYRPAWEEFSWHSDVVNGWLEHMCEWASQNKGVGMIILHKPRKPIGSSIAVIKIADWIHLMEARHLL
jgi:hypothetical protein